MRLIYFQEQPARCTLSDLQRNSSDRSSGKRDSVKQRSRIQLALNAALFSSSQIEHRFAASRQDDTILTMRASELGDSSYPVT
jgi:hypothetical protein